MKKNTVRLIIVFAVGLALAACSQKPESPTQSSNSSPEPSEAAPLVPDSTNTITPTDLPTDTPLPTNTFTQTSTNTLTPTFTITPTPTQAFNVPGYYAIGNCKIIFYDLYPSYAIEFCILAVTIEPNGQMIYNVSWTIHFHNPVFKTKRSDAGNSNIYLLDNLGNRYDHISAGGGAARDTRVMTGETVIGWFKFNSAQEGAISFTFYHDDYGFNFSGMSFFDPYIPETLGLFWHPLSFEYSGDSWESGASEEGGSQLTHRTIPTCQLIEWEPSEPQGSLKNTIELGGITYLIYGYNEANWSVREYVAIEGIEGYDPDIPPIFHAILPFDDSLQCIFDVSEVLSTLQLSDP